MTDPICKVPYAKVSSDPTFASAVEIRDFTKIEAEIEKVTNQLAGNAGDISRKPIHIMIVRREGPMFTLIDLPGKTTLKKLRRPTQSCHEPVCICAWQATWKLFLLSCREAKVLL